MGPLAYLFALNKYQQPIVLDGPPSARMPYDDPPISLGDQPASGLPRQYNGPMDWMFNKPPAAPTPAFRGPEMDAGPAPPTGGPLTAMFQRK